jgi:Family of unknown function (DUF5305)
VKIPAVLLVVFALALVVGLYTVASIDANPSATTNSATLLSYAAETRFDYQASLRPNTLYGNGTLGPGGGALYTSLVLGLNLTYSYWLNLSAPSDVTFGGGYALTVSVPGAWSYPLNTSLVDVTPVQGTSSFTFADQHVVDIPNLLELLSQIENETQVMQSSYDLNFTAFEVASIDYDGQPEVHSISYPVLTFVLSSGQLTPQSLSGSSNGSIPTTVQITDSNRATDLDLAVVACVALAAAVACMVYLTVRPRRKKVDLSADLRSMTAPYQDAIATTWTAPRKENVVVIRDWEDLVHVADMLGKPILRYVLRKRDPPRHFFYVLDGPIQYIYLVPPEGRRAEEEIADLP